MLGELLDLTRPLILFDLETTGLDPESARVVQYAHRVYQPDGGIGEFFSLVNPEVPIPADASASHGITTDTLATACSRCKQPKNAHPLPSCTFFRPVPTFRDLAKSLARGFADADFAGYNVRSYDLRVMTAEFKRCGIVFDYSNAYILDSLQFWRVIEARTLTDAVAYFSGRKLEGAHDALVDVIGTEEVIIGQLRGHRWTDFLLQKAKELKLPRTMKELHELQWPRDPNAIDAAGKFKFMAGAACFAFGKNNGRPIDSDPKYLQWMLTGDFEPDTKRVARDVLNGKLPTQRDLPLTSEAAGE